MDTSDYANPEIEITKLKDLIKTAALSKVKKSLAFLNLGISLVAVKNGQRLLNAGKRVDF